MPLNDSDPGTCWAVKTPILYGLTSFGQIKAPKGQEVQVCTLRHCLHLY